MVILIAGTTHTGKTVLAQRLMERYRIPYFSIDHLKMGLIRSGQTALTPNDTAKLTPYLWAILKEMIKTAIENKQHLIIEGCYIPFDWKNDFTDEYLRDISFYCLIMTDDYIENRFDDILRWENRIERRLYPSDITQNELRQDNARNLRLCRQYGLPYILIDKTYDVQIDLALH